jgi:diaminohydroxyphosphoribosylaminopyrimidine deaminase/5-amino-6-(5-phosphoribosylamino)uracil reductase
MKRALSLARVRKGETHPNPTVGCVIVKDGKIVGEGFHRKAGEPHAEAVALKKAGKRAKGATVYVTLEPCSHYGRTPPCAVALAKAGVKRVVMATLDPNPLVAGKGVQILKNFGVKVEVGLLEKEAKELNVDFFYWIVNRTPLVSLKIAQTLDGFISTSPTQRVSITNSRSRKFVHRIRCEHTAVLIGIDTALVDNPLLTVRDYYCERQPLRVILDTHLRFDERLNLANTAVAPTLVFTASDNGKKAERLRQRGIEVVKVSAEDGRVDLKEVLRKLGRRDILSVLVEGGARVFESFLRQNLFHRLYLFTAPKVFGRGVKAFPEGVSLEGLKLKELKKFGDDTLAVYENPSPQRV